MAIPYEWLPGTLGNIVLSVVLVAFALTVGGLARFRGPARWYALFGVALGVTSALGNVSGNILFGFAPDTLRWPTEGVPADVAYVFMALRMTMAFLSLVIVYAVARLAAHYGVRRLWRMPALWIFWVAAIVGVQWVDAVHNRDAVGYAAAIAWTSFLSTPATLLTDATMLAAAAGLAHVYAKHREAGAAILGAALCALPIVQFGNWAGIFQGELKGVAGVVLASAATLWVALHWLLVPRGVTNTPWRVASVPIAFLALAVLGSMYVPGIPAHGLARLFDVVLVGYAILRLHYLDLDIKIRWGISKATLAAAFVAVFFIASEAAQAFFGDRFENEYFGIVAAGALVFGIAPIMRWADRFADKAIPTAPSRASAAEIFTHAVQAALADGRLSPKEEIHLAQVAEKLGLRPSEMAAIRHGAMRKIAHD